MQTFLNHEKGKITQLNHSKDSRYSNSVFRARISEWRNTRFDIPNHKLCAQTQNYGRKKVPKRIF